MTSRIALATAAEFHGLDEDGPVLVDALSRLAIDAEPAVWSDQDVDWSAYELVVVRSTWDYAPRRDEFVAWGHRVAAASKLANPAEVLEWNTDKTYLRELAGAGLPVVPTDWLEPGDTFAAPVDGEYVVKPTVSAGSKDTNRYVAGDHDDLASTHVASLLTAGRSVMVQPYLRGVDTAGESALLFFGGEFSHAVRKGPLLTPAMEPVAGAYLQESMSSRDATPEELDVAQAVLDALPSVAPTSRADLAYARVDLVPGTDGSPVLLELELAEPSMFLQYDGAEGRAAADRFAAVIARMCG